MWNRCNGFNDGLLMLECEDCRQWFHAGCIQVRRHEKRLCAI